MYNILLFLHIISFISWMAAMLYLPRLFVYHTKATPGEELYNTLLIMEKKLAYYIMIPAGILSTVFGICLITLDHKYYFSSGWLHIKFLLIIILFAINFLMLKYYTNFKNNSNTKSQKYFKIFNETPTILMIMIVFLVKIKPF